MKKEYLKISIRFFNDREVRAVWEDEHAKWWFSVVDVVGILNEENDYTKTRNYWKYLKAKLKKENNKLVSATTQLKLTAADDKKYKTDMLDSTVLQSVPKNYFAQSQETFVHSALLSENAIFKQLYLAIMNAQTIGNGNFFHWSAIKMI